MSKINKKETHDIVNYYLFEISHRQSVHKDIRGFLMSRFTEKDIEEEFFNWCESFNFWRYGESFITHSYKKIKIPSRESLLKKWPKICKEKQEINDKHEMMRMMLNHAK